MSTAFEVLLAGVLSVAMGRLPCARRTKVPKELRTSPSTERLEQGAARCPFCGSACKQVKLRDYFVSGRPVIRYARVLQLSDALFAGS